MPEAIGSRILHLPGYGGYACEADETTGTLWLWVRQPAPEPYDGGGCGISVRDVHSWTERRVRDLPWGTWQVGRVLEVHRVRGRRCGVRTERRPFVAGQAHDTTRLEAAVARDCEAAPVSRVARTWHVPPETARRMDTRVLRRWAAERPRKSLRSLGVDEISLGQRDTFLTVVSARDRGEPIWAGPERTRETLDRFFAEARPPRRRRAVRAVCVDMWEPFAQSLRAPRPPARIVYDKFHTSCGT
jgi:transposase